MKEVKLINIYDLLHIIEKDKHELNIHVEPGTIAIHNGEYNHFIKRILEMPEYYNVEEKVNSVVSELLSEKQHELYGMYNNEMERMIAEDRMERRNEIIDDCIEIVKREFEMKAGD